MRVTLPLAILLAISCAAGSALAQGSRIEAEASKAALPAGGATEDLAASDASAGGLAGTSWRLVKIMSMDDSVETPDDPSLYTLEFGTDGSMKLRADCNRGTGSWSSESASQLEFGPIAATSALCPPGSLHDRYLSQFQWVRSYVLEKGHLFLATMADGSIVEFEPTTDAPVAAMVLGEEIRTADAAEIQQAILTRLFDRYATANGIAVEDAQVDAYLNHMERVKQADRRDREARIADLERRLGSEGLTTAERKDLEAEQAQLKEMQAALAPEGDLKPAEAAEVEALRRDMARSVIRAWKLNRALYREYGGRIVYQQLGPEPVDAYRRFLESQQREGAFAIHEPALEAGFWHYFTDDSIHSFYEPGSDAEARAFDVPPWQAGS